MVQSLLPRAQELYTIFIKMSDAMILRVAHMSEVVSLANCLSCNDSTPSMPMRKLPAA